MNTNEKLNNWLLTGERGISSEAIASKMTGVNFTGQWGMGHPLDPSDFRRCLLLLKAVPEFKERLNEMEEVSPVWKDMVENWDELEKLYYEEVHTGKCPKLYDRMKELRGW